MLNVLQRITEAVNAEDAIEPALRRVVAMIKEALEVDVTSVYLTVEGDAESSPAGLLLVATLGLKPEAAGRVQLGWGQGLVGLVARRAEPLNLDDAQTHPHFHLIPETGEHGFHGFCAVPIIHRRRVLGVLCVQRVAPHRLSSEQSAFLMTLAAQLATAVSHAEACGELQRTAHGEPPKRSFDGVPSGQGLAIGRAVVAYSEVDLDLVPDRAAEEVDAEAQAFRRALAEVREEFRQLGSDWVQALPREERVLFDAYALMLDSESLSRTVLAYVHAGNWAPGALRQTIEEYCRAFQGMSDAYFRERAEDVRDLGRRILGKLRAQSEGARSYPERTILVGSAISVSQLLDVPRDRLAGIVSCSGSSSSHVAILARAMGVPTVMAAAKLPVAFVDGRQLVVDGYRGRVLVEPPPEVRRALAQLIEEEAALSEDLQALSPLPSESADGEPFTLFVNIGLAEVKGLDGASAGVGLYRTETLFQMRDYFPSEDEQCRIYSDLMASVSPQPVTIRTLDIGGDKPLSYFPIHEDNPFLGWRGIRICLDHPEIFLTQLRAMLRAHARHGNLEVLFPMISGIGELEQSLAYLQQARDELEGDGIPVALPPVGVMIEVPAALYMIDELLDLVDSVSIGTNDLTQYLLAVDRNNAQVSDLFEGLHPAVLRALDGLARAASRHNKPVTVCGELAGDPLGCLILFGLGYRRLSMNASSLARVKWVLRSFRAAETRQLAVDALTASHPQAVRRPLLEALESRGLGGLVRAGR